MGPAAMHIMARMEQELLQEAIAVLKIRNNGRLTNELMWFLGMEVELIGLGN